MSYKHVSILLLLQVFLFVQCSTAETPDSKKDKKNEVRNSFVDSSSISAQSEAESLDKTEKEPFKKGISNIAAKNNKNLKQGNFKQIKFGFNIGFLADLGQADLFKKVLPIIKQDGITDLRVYEPFTKNLITHPGMAANLLSPLVRNGFNVLLDISNFPDIPSIQYNHASDDAQQSSMRSFTNRRAPVNIAPFQSYLSNFLDDLQSKNLLDNVSFEIGNEPDSKLYFWGQPSEFINAAKAIKQTLAKYNKPVYCCGFTSNFAKQGSSKSSDYYNFLNDNSFFDNVNLSFHYYRDQGADITQVKLPRLNNSIITEFNMFAYQKVSTPGRTDITNSPQFGALLIRALILAYNNNIKTIYLFKLVDDPKKNGTTGFFDANGQERPSYQYFKDIYNVVKNKYAVKNNGDYVSITGDNETILYALNNNISIPTNRVVSSIQPNKKKLDKDEWVILRN